jgi:hypothetical protein
MMAERRLSEGPDVQVIWDEWVQEIMAYLSKRVRVVIDKREDA